jgi:hypothetical protein
LEEGAAWAGSQQEYQLGFGRCYANGIGRQRYELSKQLQDLHVDVALFSEIHLKPHERFFIPNCHFYRTDRHPGRKAELPLQLEKGSPTTT